MNLRERLAGRRGSGRWHRLRAWNAVLLAAGLVALPRVAVSQVVSGGDFDICDYCGTLVGNTAHLTGRAGFGTDLGKFVLINAATSDQDVDHDGYTPGFDFSNLAVTDTSDLVNISNPARTILRGNLVVSDFLNPLRNGYNNIVGFYYNIPNGTPAGTYRGHIEVSDTTLPATLNANGEALRVDGFEVEVVVLPTSAIGLAQSDTAARLDSLVLRGRSGQTVSGVFRIANLGNVDLTNATVQVEDLIATSGTGLRIPREAIEFSPSGLTNVAIGDTDRITVSVHIPTGLLAGEYRGDLIVQADGVPQLRVPLVVIVTTAGGIVFEDNPVYGNQQDNAVIIFNADPGTQWRMRIFDMIGITTFAAEGTVFAGTPATGGTGAIGFPGDQAVRYVWPLKNGVGYPVAGGMYLVVIEAIENGQHRLLQNKLMVIR